MICRYGGLVTGKWWKYRGLGIGADTERTWWKLIIFGLAVITFATTHSQRGVQFAPKWSDHIHHIYTPAKVDFFTGEILLELHSALSKILVLNENN